MPLRVSRMWSLFVLIVTLTANAAIVAATVESTSVVSDAIVYLDATTCTYGAPSLPLVDLSAPFPVFSVTTATATNATTTPSSPVTTATMLLALCGATDAGQQLLNAVSDCLASGRNTSSGPALAISTAAAPTTTTRAPATTTTASPVSVPASTENATGTPPPPAPEPTTVTPTASPGDTTFCDRTTMFGPLLASSHVSGAVTWTTTVNTTEEEDSQSIVTSSVNSSASAVPVIVTLVYEALNASSVRSSLGVASSGSSFVVVEILCLGQDKAAGADLVAANATVYDETLTWERVTLSAGLEGNAVCRLFAQILTSNASAPPAPDAGPVIQPRLGTIISLSILSIFVFAIAVASILSYRESVAASAAAASTALVTTAMAPMGGGQIGLNASSSPLGGGRSTNLNYHAL